MKEILIRAICATPGHSFRSPFASWFVVRGLCLIALFAPMVNAADTYVTAPPQRMDVAGPALVNAWLRDQSPIFNPWDLGAQIRARYEIREDAGSFPNRDFRKTGVDNDNSYFLLR